MSSVQRAVADFNQLLVSAPSRRWALAEAVAPVLQRLLFDAKAIRGDSSYTQGGHAEPRRGRGGVGVAERFFKSAAVAVAGLGPGHVGAQMRE